MAIPKDVRPSLTLFDFALYAFGVTDLSLGSAAQRRHPRETDFPTLRHHYVFC
jgi:hypothetical protein